MFITFFSKASFNLLHVIQPFPLHLDITYPPSLATLNDTTLLYCKYIFMYKYFIMSLIIPQT